MNRALGVTDHAVDRYIKRWRPGLDVTAARAELELLAAKSGPTKRNTLVGDARLYIGTLPTGERVPLAVRGDAVITVLDAASLGPQIDMDMSMDQDLIDDSRATVEACRAMVGPPAAPLSDRERAARDVLSRWKCGEHFTDKAIKRAHEALGLAYGKKR